MRGPQDVVNKILSTVSPAFAANPNASPTFPCSTPHTLSFQIGGTQFPVDPRDFVSQSSADDASTCVANNVVSTDAPSTGALFEWSLGDPFLKSTLVAFYYGNLTHPSQDPPRIGFMSMVPANASQILEGDVSAAQADGGSFSSKHRVLCSEFLLLLWHTNVASLRSGTEDAAPTASTVVDVSTETTSAQAGGATPVNTVLQNTQEVDPSAGVTPANDPASPTASNATGSPPSPSPSSTNSNSAGSSSHAPSGLLHILIPALSLLVYFAS